MDSITTPEAFIEYYLPQIQKEITEHPEKSNDDIIDWISLSTNLICKAKEPNFKQRVLYLLITKLGLLPLLPGLLPKPPSYYEAVPVPPSSTGPKPINPDALMDLQRAHYQEQKRQEEIRREEIKRGPRYKGLIDRINTELIKAYSQGRVEAGITFDQTDCSLTQAMIIEAYETEGYTTVKTWTDNGKHLKITCNKINDKG